MIDVERTCEGSPVSGNELTPTTRAPVENTKYSGTGASGAGGFSSAPSSTGSPSSVPSTGIGTAPDSPSAAFASGSPSVWGCADGEGASGKFSSACGGGTGSAALPGGGGIRSMVVGGLPNLGAREVRRHCLESRLYSFSLNTSFEMTNLHAGQSCGCLAGVRG